MTAAAPPAAPGHRPGPTNVVILSKIPEGVSEQQVATAAGRHNEVVKVSYRPGDLDGLGWAIIAYASPELAKASRERLDGKAMPGSSGTASGSAVEAALGEGLFGDLKALNDQESPWKEARTPQGHVYYFHVVTRQTTWLKPLPDFSPAPPPPAAAGGRGAAPKAPAAPMQGQAAFQAAQAAFSAAVAPAAPPAAGSTSGVNLNSGPVGANLFIYHIPGMWDDSILRQHFEHFGKILSCRVQVDNDGRSRGFGFVSFDAPNSAQAAIAGMHGFPVEGKHLKVQLKKGDEQQLTGQGVNPPPPAPLVGGLLDIQQPPPPLMQLPPPPMPNFGGGGNFGGPPMGMPPLPPPPPVARPGPY